MKLRIRCPSCRTVLNVPAGADPVCPACGFGGVGDPPQPSQPAGWEPAPAEGAPAEWQEAPAGDWAETPQTPEGWDAPAEAPKKRGLFSRRKK
ncbi:MAG: hypothetical protein QOD77_2166 [Thermoplasmata archaeon]|jgi:LSD1 subclass zinc finger protein|nr:hypothetical protein [Thermoplasmata archaeon]